MGFLDALMDTEKQVNDTIKQSIYKFASELKCPVNEVRILITTDDKGDELVYMLFHKQNFKRKIQVNEII